MTYFIEDKHFHATELRNEDYSNVTFRGCTFQNVIIDRCNCTGTTFVNCYLHNVTFGFRNTLLATDFSESVFSKYGVHFCMPVYAAQVYAPRNLRAPDAEFIAWKQVLLIPKQVPYITKLGLMKVLVPVDAQRIMPLTGDKVRVSKLKPLAWYEVSKQGLDQCKRIKNKGILYAIPRLYWGVEYRLNEMTEEVDIDTNLALDCSFGYNVFMFKEQARNF